MCNLPFPFLKNRDRNVPDGLTSELKGPNSVRVAGLSSHTFCFPVAIIQSYSNKKTATNDEK
jgi:hypothetical protein